MTHQELAQEIEKLFFKHFPNGWIDSRVEKGFSNNQHISVRFGLLGDKSYSGGIVHNDPLHSLHMVWIQGELYEIDNSISGLSVNPKEKFLAMSTVKTAIRRAKNLSTEKVLNKYASYFAKLSKIVQENQHDIYKRSDYQDKFFITK
jgi:hypothetical protein